VDSTAAAITTAIGATAVQNATHADAADTATTATTFSTTIFTISESGNKLNFIASPTITGSLASTTLTVTVASVGFVNKGAVLSAATIAGSPVIVGQLTSTETASASIAYSSGGAVGENSIVLANVTGVVIGQLVSGIGVAAGTFVSFINSDANMVFLCDKDGAAVTLSLQAAGTYTFANAKGKGTYTITNPQTVLSTNIVCTKTIASIGSSGILTTIGDVVSFGNI
jgi:hypothetical protein